MKKRVAVGLSGGVDSAVTAALLVRWGYEVAGVYLEAWREPGCRAEEDRRDALKVATHLGIPFRVLDVREEYRRRVVEYFFEAYKQGLTPNPDVVCNREIKFGIFYDWAVKQGFDKVATGHYARVAQCHSSTVSQRLVQRGKDNKKDQSYFLWRVEPKKLARVEWPLGEMRKEEVRQRAREWGLPVADKPDSMGICFIGEVDVREMLRERLGEKEGNVLLVQSSKRKGQSHSVKFASHLVIGKHRGLWFYTIGQRGGFEINKKKLKELGLRPERMKPLYVVGKEVDNNFLLVGEREDCYSDQLSIINYQLYVGKEELEKMVRRGEVWVRVRNLGKLCSVSSIEYSVLGMKVRVREEIFGVAGGQAVVFYWRWNGKEGEEVIVGGGEIGPSK